MQDLLTKVVSRAKERTVREFIKEADRIQIEQAAKGRLGGIVGALMLDAAGKAIVEFGRSAVVELLEVIQTSFGGNVPLEAAEWVRASLNGVIEALVTGFAQQIDGRKTTGRAPITTQRLEPFGLEAKRDVDIELSKAGLKSLASTPVGSAKGHAQVDRTPKFNFLVASQRDEWNGSPFRLQKERFLQFAEPEIKDRFRDLSPNAISELKRLPSLFAYEGVLDAEPLFGRILDVTPQTKDIRIDYEIIPVAPFLTFADLDKLRSQLQIKDSFELHRRHWEVKEADLRRILRQEHGIELPHVTTRPTIDITTHKFRVALSFPGEERAYVELVALTVERALGDNSVFYDFFYKAQLAVPNADTRLQKIYGKQATLLVVFLSSAYQNKEWCGLEWRVIREKIKEREGHAVMFIRTDDGAVEGVMSTDGYIDTRLHTPEEISDFILERLLVLERAA